MKKSISPEVSVVITNYNYGEYLEQAIQSVLRQTYKKIKLYIVDDASSDDSGAILNKYANVAIIIKHRKNKGIVPVRNEALGMVDTPYLLFLDADDWINPDYIETLLTAAEKNRLDVAYCGMQYYIDGKKGMDWIPPEFNLERLKNENYIHSASLLRTRAIGDTRFDKGMEKLTHEDWDFFLSLALKGAKFARIDGASLNYRFKTTGRNITNDDADEKFANLYKYLYEKYNSERPGEIGYLAYYRFVNSFLRQNKRLTEAEASRDDFEHRARILESELSSVRSSNAYKIGRLLTLPYRLIKRIIIKFRSLGLKRIILTAVKESGASRAIRGIAFNYRNRSSSHEPYFISKHGEFNRNAKHAVVLHLYYLDNWDKVFHKKIKLLSDRMDIDLYVTMPESNEHFIDTIREEFKGANVLIVPNRGRDVLPFVKTASILESMGYEKVLKIHSKKSNHRDIHGNTAESGEQWLSKMVEALIPNDRDTFLEMTKLLDKKSTGMVGAKEYFYPLKMYLKNNRKLVELSIGSVGRDIFAGDVSRTLERYGYFGGTMFWVDIKAIKETYAISYKNFEHESAQTDATMAHALERVFCILPQIKGMKLYANSREGIKGISSKDSIYPPWYYDDVSGGKAPISIVVPVYSDWSSLSKNISSLRKLIGNSEDIFVHYVNDCGPDADKLEKSIKDNISGMANFFYYRNPKNLGFVQTCNRATFELVDKKHDVLLLNSDTKVTNNFVFEMRRVLYSEDDIGAVTSRSNNATIWSVPMTSRLANHRVASYVFYRLIKHRLPYKYISPTIHGFCVLIRREVINRYGLFDEVYGKGYGEENDFAMRLRSHGWRCAVANYSFVFHYESRSFGNETRNRQIELNEKILIKRYPEYRELVQEYWDGVEEPLK